MQAVQRIQRQAALTAVVNPWAYNSSNSLPPSLLFGLQGLLIILNNFKSEPGLIRKHKILITMRVHLYFKALSNISYKMRMSYTQQTPPHCQCFNICICTKDSINTTFILPILSSSKAYWSQNPQARNRQEAKTSLFYKTTGSTRN